MADDELIPFDPSLKKKKKKKKTPFDIDAVMGESEATDGAPTQQEEDEDKEKADEDVSLDFAGMKKKKKKKKVEEDEDTDDKAQEKADEDVSLDFAGMKKKKKKKKTFDMEELGDALPTEEDGGDKGEDKSDAVDDDLSLDFAGMKKKKKKKKAFDTDDGDAESSETADTPQESTALDGGEEADFSLPAKKKKKKKQVNFDELEEEDMGQDDDDERIDSRLAPGSTDKKSWLGSDRDYTYDELLCRVFDIIREKNPDMVAGEKKKFVMRPPQVLKVGTRKSSFANFSDICRLLHRQPKHVLAFLLAELGTSGSVDGNNQLIIRGRYNQKQIENVLRRYIKEYVTCHTCRSPETLLQKDTRLFFLQCETCGSRCSVASIKSGFQAVTGKRAAIRAKTT